MARNLTRCQAQFQKARKKLPLGVASNFRYWGDDKTIYVTHGKGGRIWDMDDNEYIDYRLGYGPAILGYADDRVDAAVVEAMSVGGVFALATEPELELAQRVSEMVPAAELVRYSNSGTEAVMAALRIARGYTGKDAYVVVEGGYHGVFDAVLWYSDVEGWDPAGPGAPSIEPYSDGVPKLLKKLVHYVPLNDADALRDLFVTHARDIGALLIEPIMGNCCGIMAERQYMQDVRALCDEFGVVLIIDEVKTGFRVGRGGVQELMGVQADLCTFAKALANGYPISVVAGREAIMRKIEDGVVHGGTFTAHAMSLAAANKTLEILQETPALETIAQYGSDLQQGMSKILGERGIAHSFSGHPSMGGLFFRETPPSNYREWIESDYAFYDALALELHELGVLCEPDSREPWFICEAHDAQCLADTMERFETAVDRTLKQSTEGKRA